MLVRLINNETTERSCCGMLRIYCVGTTTSRIQYSISRLARKPPAGEEKKPSSRNGWGGYSNKSDVNVGQNIPSGCRTSGMNIAQPGRTAPPARRREALAVARNIGRWYPSRQDTNALGENADGKIRSQCAGRYRAYNNAEDPSRIFPFCHARYNCAYG
jgi:hypothetical protein|uniref:Uncharacterized protein n=1 Tax=Sipha flava TaxID=143950 RepID=A0A2S2QXL2_9HEMI